MRCTRSALELCWVGVHLSRMRKVGLRSRQRHQKWAGSVNSPKSNGGSRSRLGPPMGHVPHHNSAFLMAESKLAPKSPRPRRRSKCVRMTHGLAWATTVTWSSAPTDEEQVKDQGHPHNGRYANKSAMPSEEADRRAKFAKELARSEFGRFYFDERQARLLLEATRPRQRPRGADRK